ncbi:SH3 domain-containing protein [Sphingomonas sp.]|uniref:SH3 domain-containing protein n=1 Tax=Sphingomonas sp. TaxID=28214 RepID=UPI001DB28CEB|nr:SH3 domain-containing protein [Sphingomonas sp.]MBX9796172.1 hypothetical protein [Sphingomonas sp.]
MRRLAWSLAGLALVAAGSGGVAWAQKRAVPYFASIRAPEARMRTGPGRNYPISWKYVRQDLPVKVVDIYRDWRKIEDPGGTQGWMKSNLLADTRTALVLGSAAELRDAPRFDAKVSWRAAPGVVGRVSKCARGWCFLDVRGRGGFVEANRLWGVAPDEELA